MKLGRAQQYQQRGTIKYVWTTSGPEPVDYQQSPLDYDHYLTKQLQPVAEGILPFVNDDFATNSDRTAGAILIFLTHSAGTKAEK
ncbi:hypothetical protein LNO81_03660 [Klebsiella variicola subsp. variicola]|nr:hypothetical protein [Klebsiella variicola subsp. variicola]